MVELTLIKGGDRMLLDNNVQAIADAARTLFKALPNVEGIVMRPTSVRLCDKNHQQLEMIFYTADQEDNIPDSGMVYRREELLEDE